MSRESMRYNSNVMNAQSHLLRKGRFSETGRIYLVTTVTRERAPVFSELWIARTAIAQLRHVTNAFACDTLAYVLMPDHLHWLVRLDRAELSRAVGAFKANSAREVNLRLERDGQALWQRGFHDHAVRREESLVDLARYVVMNPIRAGLARRPGEYPHWDAVWV